VRGDSGSRGTRFLVTHAYPICSRHHVNLQRHTRGPTRDRFVRNMREFARVAASFRLRGYPLPHPQARHEYVHGQADSLGCSDIFATW
jgi:hypothetical protein